MEELERLASCIINSMGDHRLFVYIEISARDLVDLCKAIKAIPLVRETDKLVARVNELTREVERLEQEKTKLLKEVEEVRKPR